MEKAPVTERNVAEVASRFLRLYTGAISDILDKNGYRNQVLPYYITPFTTANRVAGMAFTGQGYPCADIAHDDTKTRLKILDSISPGTVSVWVWATGGVIPSALTMDVLVAAEDIFEREKGMREELRRGVSVTDAYANYGSLCPARLRK